MERNIKIDLFKGVAISLVLIGHSIQGACTIENSDCFENIFFNGAGDGSRTHVISLEG